MKRLIYALMTILLISACDSKRQETAQIVQRRLKDPDKLVITYRFYTGEKWVYDSTEINNRIIPRDSLTVIFDPEKPDENSLQIP